MTLHLTDETVRAALSSFAIEGQLVGYEPLLRGHINRTYVSTWESAGGRRRFLHQRINDHVFQNVAGLMRNVEAVTRRLGEVADSSPYEALRLVATRAGDPWWNGASGAWRTYAFIEGTCSFDRCTSREQAFSTARIFGWFQTALADLDADSLVETIPAFFSPGSRWQQFEEALAASAFGSQPRGPEAERLATAIHFAREHRWLFQQFQQHLDTGRFAPRVVHGDTKLNNVLFDIESGAARAVVDLDTAMPGYLLYDFGDMVRTAAALSAEDEPNELLAGIDFEIFDALREGYLECAADSMGALEHELLPLAGPLVTMIIGVRFLTDHLAGDTYFGAARPGHNLDRACVQFAQVRALLDKTAFGS